MKTKRKNVFMLVLMQTLTKTNETLKKATIQNKDVDMLEFFKDIMNFANENIEKLEPVKNMSAKEANKELKLYNFIYNSLLSAFNILFELLTEDEMNIIQPEYERFLTNVQILRDDIEFFADNEKFAYIENYALSTPVFSEDWDSEEDKHWDNY